MSIQTADNVKRNDQPARSVFQVEAIIKRNSPINKEYHLLNVDAPQSILRCKPGQFFHILCPARAAHQPYLRRPMSIFGYSLEKGELQFLYKVTGNGTRALTYLKKNDVVNLLGPLGIPFTIKPNWVNLLILARGVGLATLAPLAQEANRLERNLITICSARNSDVLMSDNHFRKLGAEVITVTDTEGTSKMENVRHIIEDRICGDGIDAMYTCGSNRMLQLLQGIGTKYAIPGQVALEQQMACGLGMCQCCVRSFYCGKKIVQKRVCRDGPVFGLQEAMAW
ncbi:MAG: dihydroorotate dehydrogenase electron transfer subunit [Aestuariivita sp.]|nr:dihydroorotate dehydrogenase electron transfer subunit [Aestuariivita sp.]